MNKLGGIAALIAGILGAVLSGWGLLITSPLFVILPFEQLIVWLRVGSCLAIAVLGALLIYRRSRAVSGLLMITSIVGAMIDDYGTIMTGFMMLALAGGILGLVSAANARRAKAVATGRSTVTAEAVAGESDDVPPPRIQTNNRLIWLLAFAPLIAAGTNMFVFAVFTVSLWLPALLLFNVGLGFCDLGLLESTEVDISRLHSGTVFLVPWYIYRRQKATRQRGYFATWLASFTLFVAMIAASPLAYTAYSNYQLRHSGIIHASQAHSVLKQRTVGAGGSQATMSEPAPQRSGGTP